MVYQDIRWLH